MLKKLKKWFRQLGTDIGEFILAYYTFFRSLFLIIFRGSEKVKNFTAGLLYRQRGRFSQPIAHFTLALLLFIGVALAPTIEESLRGQMMDWNTYSPASAFAVYSTESR